MTTPEFMFKSSIYLAFTDLIEKPENLNATINSTRIFRCRAERALSYSWRINSTNIDQGAPPEGIEVLSIAGGSTMTVYCDEAHNMSRVTCVAFLDDLTAIVSDNATLLIQG